MNIDQFTDEQADLWDELHELLPLCGCGLFDDTLLYVVTILEAIGTRTTDGYSEARIQSSFKLPLNQDERNNHEAYWFLLYMLDHLGLIDHGINIQWGWLTDKGKRAIEIYRILTQEEARHELG